MNETKIKYRQYVFENSADYIQTKKAKRTTLNKVCSVWTRAVEAQQYPVIFCKQRW